MNERAGRPDIASDAAFTPARRVLAWALMAFAIAQGIASLIDPWMFPGWQMFRRIDRFEYSMFDSKGRAVRVQDYLPSRAYWIGDRAVPLAVGAWLGRTRPEMAPLSGVLVVWEGGVAHRHRFVITRDAVMVDPPIPPRS